MVDRYSVRFTSEAEADLDAIADYMAEWRGMDEADALLDRVTEHIATLDRFPLRGPVPKELGGSGERNVRQILFRQYRIFYDVEGDTVLVFLIADGRRDIEALLAARLLAPDPPA